MPIATRDGREGAANCASIGSASRGYCRFGARGRASCCRPREAVPMLGGARKAASD